MGGVECVGARSPGGTAVWVWVLAMASSLGVIRCRVAIVVNATIFQNSCDRKYQLLRRTLAPVAETAEPVEAAGDWLSETEMQSWRALIQTTTGLLACSTASSRPSTACRSASTRCSSIMSDAGDDGLRMQDLAGTLHLSPSGITRRIDGMVRPGLVERRQCPTDRRGSNAMLTDDGWNRLAEAAPTHVRGVRDALRRPVERTPARERRRTRCRRRRSIPRPPRAAATRR